MQEWIQFLFHHIPHRWLNKKAEGTKRLFNGLAACLAYGEGFVSILRRNQSVSTAQEVLGELEQEYGLDFGQQYEMAYRRKRIQAKIRMQDCPVTEKDLLSMLSVLGFSDCRIENDFRHSVMHVFLSLPRQVKAEQLSDMTAILLENVRAHVLLHTNFSCPETDILCRMGGCLAGSHTVTVLPEYQEDYRFNLLCVVVGKTDSFTITRLENL